MSFFILLITYLLLLITYYLLLITYYFYYLLLSLNPTTFFVVLLLGLWLLSGCDNVATCVHTVTFRPKKNTTVDCYSISFHLNSHHHFTIPTFNDPCSSFVFIIQKCIVRSLVCPFIHQSVWSGDTLDIFQNFRLGLWVQGNVWISILHEQCSFFQTHLIFL